MITCIALVTLNALAICIALLVVNSVQASSKMDAGDALHQTVTTVPASIAILCYAAIFSWFTIGLFGFHVILVFRGTSTNEYIKGHLDKWNQYSLGPLGNFLDLFKLPRKKVKPAILPPIKEPYVGEREEALAVEDIQLSN
jgi:hypothetical protein